LLGGRRLVMFFECLMGAYVAFRHKRDHLREWCQAYEGYPSGQRSHRCCRRPCGTCDRWLTCAEARLRACLSLVCGDDHATAAGHASSISTRPTCGRFTESSPNAPNPSITMTENGSSAPGGPAGG